MVPPKQLQVKFYQSDKGNEPVREWLKSLKEVDRRIIGADLKTVEYGWPIGMPLCRNIRGRIWEVRSKLSGKNNIARVRFCTTDNHIVLLNGFIKKTQKAPNDEIDLAEERLRNAEL